MKKFYLRLYAGMENQPGSQYTAERRNKVINDCVKELREQGLDIEALPCGSSTLVLYDENGTPMTNSKFSRFCTNMKIKFNRFIWNLKH